MKKKGKEFDGDRAKEKSERQKRENGKRHNGKTDRKAKSKKKS